MQKKRGVRNLSPQLIISPFCGDIHKLHHTKEKKKKKIQNMFPPMGAEM